MPYKDPQERNAQGRRWRLANPGKFKASQDKWRAANPEKVHTYDRTSNAKRAGTPARKTQSRHAHLKRYGLTPAAWDELFASQGKTCASCAAPTPGSRLGWQTDHNHATGMVRGILCHRCNVALGFLENEPRNRILRSYLEKHQ